MFVDQIWPAGWQVQAPAARRSGNRRLSVAQRRQDELLDEALKETFPASDPVSVIRLT